MAGETATHHDRDKVYRARFERQQRAYLRTLITPALIEEYRKSPLGQHSGDLERVLNYFRRGPFEGKYVLFELEANRKYKIVTTTAQQGGLPQEVDGKVYTDKNEALHAVFLKRVDALLASDS